MPALNFKKRFAQDVESGKKHQAIIRLRKIPIEQGDRLFLFASMRRIECRKLGEFDCSLALSFEITLEERAYCNGYILTCAQLSSIANKDGFRTSQEFIDFLKGTYGLPFVGQLIKWENE